MHAVENQGVPYQLWHKTSVLRSHPDDTKDATYDKQGLSNADMSEICKFWSYGRITFHNRNTICIQFAIILMKGCMFIDSTMFAPAFIRGQKNLMTNTYNRRNICGTCVSKPFPSPTRNTTNEQTKQKHIVCMQNICIFISPPLGIKCHSLNILKTTTYI